MLLFSAVASSNPFGDDYGASDDEEDLSESNPFKSDNKKSASGRNPFGECDDYDETKNPFAD